MKRRTPMQALEIANKRWWDRPAVIKPAADLPPDPHEEFRRILTRDQERAIVEFFYPHRGCSWCNESGWMVVDGKRIKCMGRDES